MKKRLFSLLIIALLTITAWADISAEQLNTYMKVSGTDVYFENMQKLVEMKAKMSRKEISSDVLKEIRTVVSSKENIEQFTKVIKSLDEKDYKELIEFYSTEVGQKSADIVRNFDELKMQKEMIKFSKKELSKERKRLFIELIDTTISEKNMEKAAKRKLEASVKSLPKEMQEAFRKKMKAHQNQIKSKMRDEAIKGSVYIYRDFSDADLKQLIKHAKTSLSQREGDMILSARLNYFKAVKTQLIKVLKKD